MHLHDVKEGMQVVYHPMHALMPEQGVVTSKNDTYVFVRFGSDIHSKAVRPVDIYPTNVIL